MAKTIIISGETMGRGPEDLGYTLMASFLRKLCLAEKKPEKMVFYNSGVKLITHDSHIADAIEMLAKAGVEIIACGTCVNYYDLSEEVEPEWISDMPTIISTLIATKDAITI